MLCKGVKIDEIARSEKFLNDLETISKALFADKPLRTSAGCCGSTAVEPQLSAPKNKKFFERGNKPSFWSWRGLKALTHSRNRSFKCCFSLLVHSIEGLPSFFDDVRLIVHWKRRGGEQMTSSARVHKGVARFEGRLTSSCSVNFSTSHNLVKYEAKHFLLYASVYNAGELDLGKHRIDLTRLLPLTLEELEEDKSSGKWTTDFRLSGKAKGATMNVSFGYVVIGNNREPSRKNNARDITAESFVNQTDLTNELSMRRLGNLPARLDLKPELDEEIWNDLVENKLDNGPFPSCADSCKLNSFKHPGSDEKIQGIYEFSVLENGIEDLTKEHVKPKKDPCRHKQAIDTWNSAEKVDSMLSKELLMQELEMALIQASDLMDEKLDSQEDKSKVPFQDSPLNSNALLGDLEKGASRKLDDIIDDDDFLKMLGIEHGSFDFNSESEPESPREILLKQFEKDALANGRMLNFDTENDPTVSNITTASAWEAMSNDFYHSSILESFREMSRVEEDVSASRLENFERESNGKTFQHSPLSKSDLDQHPLAEGFSSFLQTKNGWLLCSMSPALFRNSGGNLITQGSRLSLVPAEIGSGLVNKMIGINWNAIQEIALEGVHILERNDRQGLLSQIGSKIMQNMSSGPVLGEIEDGTIVEAHCATSWDLMGQGRGRKYGLLRHSCLRNYEPVGNTNTMHITIPVARNTSEEEKHPKATEKATEDEDEQEVILEYKTNFSGLKMEACKSKLWGSKNQQRLGWRWVVANGMGKKKKQQQQEVMK